MPGEEKAERDSSRGSSPETVDTTQTQVDPTEERDKFESIVSTKMPKGDSVGSNSGAGGGSGGSSSGRANRTPGPPSTTTLAKMAVPLTAAGIITQIAFQLTGNAPAVPNTTTAAPSVCSVQLPFTEPTCPAEAAAAVPTPTVTPSYSSSSSTVAESSGQRDSTTKDEQ